MRITSSAISLSAHIAIVTAVIIGTARARPVRLSSPLPPPLIFMPSHPRSESGGGNPLAAPIDPGPLPPIPISDDAPVPKMPIAPLRGGVSEPVKGNYDVVGSFNPLDQQVPEALAGPVPVYPEFLRQAGVQGRVVFEGIVDTTGRIDPRSLHVVLATNPGFIEAARTALLATLFRPARVGGRAVAVQVRLPVEFTLRAYSATR